MSLIWCFVQVIKVDTYGDSAKSSTTYFECNVNTKFNKIPELVMGLQRERDGGMISQGIGWGVNQTPEHQVEARCQWENL